MPLSERIRRRVAREIEIQGGRHDEPEHYTGDPGDPGLVGGPDSISWRIHGDLASLVVAGPAAILMELLHPSVMAGVAAHSSYRSDPLRRARNTLGYVLCTTFGNTTAATRIIERVKAIHARIRGTRPDGVAYHALDPELIGWVHTCIPWSVMMAYESTCQPLTLDDKNRYLSEQAVLGKMAGASTVPESVPELEAYVARMRPLLAMTQQTQEFLDFFHEQGPDQALSLKSSMTRMPRWARQLSGTDVSSALERLIYRPADRLRARLVRWAYPVLPCKRMALARATGSAQPRTRFISGSYSG